MHIAGHPRFRLFDTPTPLEPLPRFSAALGGPEIWAKRGEAIPLAPGGNTNQAIKYVTLVGYAA